MTYTDAYNRAFFYLCSKYPLVKSRWSNNKVLLKSNIKNKTDIQIFNLMNDYSISYKVKNELELLLNLKKVKKKFDTSKITVKIKNIDNTITIEPYDE